MSLDTRRLSTVKTLLALAANALARGIIQQTYVVWDEKQLQHRIQPVLDGWRITRQAALDFLLTNCDRVVQVPERRDDWKHHPDYFKLVSHWPEVPFEGPHDQVFYELRLVGEGEDDGQIWIVGLHQHNR